MGERATKIYSFFLCAFTGFLVGFGFAYTSNLLEGERDNAIVFTVATVAISVVAFVFGIFLHIIVHEAGHLVMGLLSGYSFVAFGVFDQLFVKQNGKIIRKKMSIVGAGGSCHLSPPDMVNGKFPHILYFFGGVLANILFSAIFFLLFFLFAQNAELLARGFLVVAGVGVYFFLLNLAPHKIDIPSDGWFIFHLGKEKNALSRRALWARLRVQAFSAQGLRSRDIPAEYFLWTEGQDLSDPLIFAAAAIKYECFIDSQKIAEARECLNELFEKTENMPGSYKHAIGAEVLFCEIISECRPAEIERVYTDSLQEYLKASNDRPETQRTLYAYELLVSKNAEKAKEHLEKFRAVLATESEEIKSSGEEIIDLIHKKT
ncbi:MAG: M50 family metallopeptidase [Defluviitaleaceae bacterium]|nr:M50 family metallopeptidase [Defluviitaleaceae bacterium]